MIAHAFAAVGTLAAAAALWVRLREPAPALALEPSPDTLDPQPLEADPPREWLTFTAPRTLGEAANPVSTGYRWPTGAERYRSIITRSAEARGVPPDLLARLLAQESAYRPDVIDGRTRSSAGAAGIAQFMPATARQFGIDPLNPDQAIPAAAQYLRQLFDRFGSWSMALAAYNWGQGNLARRGFENAPAETRAYVDSIIRDVPV